MSNRLQFNVTANSIGGWEVPTVDLVGTDRNLTVIVHGTIANSFPTTPKGKERLADWRVQIASAVKNKRGRDAWDSNNDFAIALGLRFCPALHGNHALDVENFVKSIIDGLAAGLFCEAGTDPADIQRFNFDDSNFNTLLIHRLADASNPSDEGAAISVSSRRMVW